VTYHKALIGLGDDFEAARMSDESSAEERYSGYVLKIECHSPDRQSMGQSFYSYSITREKENIKVYSKTTSMGGSRNFDYIFDMLRRFVDEENKKDDPWNIRADYYGEEPESSNDEK
jgi:hypothetical protein